MFLAVQDSSIGDLVTESLGESSFDFRVTMHYAIRADIFGRGGLSRTKRVSKFSFL